MDTNDMINGKMIFDKMTIFSPRFRRNAVSIYFEISENSNEDKKVIIYRLLE